MGASYRQFCPVAKAMELLDERWTLLVVREMLAGSRHFNELRRGLPHMSPALLSKRLQQLVAAGIVIKESDRQQVAYSLSPAGRNWLRSSTALRSGVSGGSASLVIMSWIPSC